MSPGKFEASGEVGEALYELSLEGRHDEEVGSVDELGWYALFGPPTLAILSEDSQGFVDVESFDTEADLRAAWRQIETAYEQFDSAEDIEAGNPRRRFPRRGMGAAGQRIRRRRRFPRRGMGAAGRVARGNPPIEELVAEGNPDGPDLEGAPEHLPLYERLTQTAHWMMHEAEVLKRAASDAEDADLSADTVEATEGAAEDLEEAAEVLEDAADQAEEAATEAAEDVAETIEDLTAEAVEELGEPVAEAVEEVEAAAEIVAGNPFGQWASFDECVAWATQAGKRDPEAYCASIKRTVEGNPDVEGTEPIPSPEAAPAGEPESSPPVPSEPDVAPEPQHWYKRRWQVSDRA